MQATIYNIAGQEVEKVELDDAIFGIEPNHAVIHQAMLRQQANARRGTHDTKTRADVRGGGKKPWRQKGTGRARQGSTRSPQWRHGGVVFGPHPRSYAQDMTRKARRLAIRGVLSGKAADGQLVLVDSFDTLEPRTKAMVTTLKSLNIGDKKTLIFTTGTETALRQAASNLPNIKMISAHLLSVVDMLTHDFVVLPREALNVVVGILGTTGGRNKLPLRGVKPRAATAETTRPAARGASAAATAEIAAVSEVSETAPETPRAEVSETPSIMAGDVVITYVQFKGHEHVAIKNNNDLPVDISGWMIRDKNDPKQSYTFPANTEIKPGDTVEVYTKTGHTYSFESKSPVWNDAGDVAQLLDADGKVVSTFAYGAYAEADDNTDNAEGGEGSEK